MKRKILNILVLIAIMFFGACIGEHNKAPNKGRNLDSKRIYGNKGGTPLQLANKYPEDDGTAAQRANKIREKLFPK